MRGFLSLSDAEARAAFLHTLRAVIDPGGQRVSGHDRLYLASNLPTLIVWGERDPIIPVAHGRAAHAAMPGSRLEIFAASGHFPHMDDTVRFVEVLRRLPRRPPSPRSSIPRRCARASSRARRSRPDGMMGRVERISARNSAGYDAPIGLTADPVVFTLVGDRLCVLLARRLEEPQRGMFALPGGFVGTEESPAQTAERKLREKTGVGSVHLEQLRTYADPRRDPRGWLPSIAYLALVRPEELPEEGPGRARGVLAPVDDLPELALDHETIVDDGLWRLRARVTEKTWFLRVAGALLPAAFTLGQAQRLYEALRGEAVDAANFRRDVKATALLVDTGELHSDGPGRPGRALPAALSRVRLQPLPRARDRPGVVGRGTRDAGPA